MLWSVENEDVGDDHMAFSVTLRAGINMWRPSLSVNR